MFLQAEPWWAMVQPQGHGTAVIIPRAALSPPVANIQVASTAGDPVCNEPLRLLAGYLKLVHEGLPLMTPELRRRVVTHVHDLVAMAIGATRDGAAIAAERGYARRGSRRSRPTSWRVWSP